MKVKVYPNEGEKDGGGPGGVWYDRTMGLRGKGV